MKKKLIPILIIVVILLIFFFIVSVHTDIKEKSLKENYKTIMGMVDDVVSVKGSGFQAKYYFSISGKTIFNQEVINVDNTNTNYLRKVLSGQHLMIVYDTININNSKLLLSQRNYSEFNLIPDSATLALFKQIDSLRIGNDAMK
jgi:hypothetical protein